MSIRFLLFRGSWENEGNFYLLESEKYILLLAAGKDYSLNGYQEQQIGRDYLKENGEEKTIQLTSGEVDPDQGKISRASPLGMALNNQKVGEITEVTTSQKKYKIQILVIK